MEKKKLDFYIEDLIDKFLYRDASLLKYNLLMALKNLSNVLGDIRNYEEDDDEIKELAKYVFETKKELIDFDLNVSKKLYKIIYLKIKQKYKIVIDELYNEEEKSESEYYQKYFVKKGEDDE